MSQRDMFGSSVEKRARKRKKSRRLTIDQKAAHIVRMMNENARMLTEIKGVQGWGFTMGQIADMTAYARSTALMNDLYLLVDHGILNMDVRPNIGNSLAPTTYYFFTPDEYSRALKQRRLFS